LTGALVRYLTQDDPEQSRKANKFIQEIIAQSETGFINAIVLCEMVWVLESAYGHSREIIAEVLERVLLTSQFEIQDKDVVWAAFGDFRQSRADFSDCLIGRVNQSFGCNETVSFDTALKSQPGFRLI
jgi:predicted nucleic-acid-binding protein